MHSSYYKIMIDGVTEEPTFNFPEHLRAARDISGLGGIACLGIASRLDYAPKSVQLFFVLTGLCALAFSVQEEVLRQLAIYGETPTAGLG